jgi:uncharacterized protein
MKTAKAPNPWYREPWPWLLMSGPALVIVAGVITTAIAVQTSDGVVADDYYKQGLGINRTLARDARADTLGVKAAVQFNEERDRVRVRLAGETRPAQLRLTLVHPTRAGGDQAATLARIAAPMAGGAAAESWYEGKLQAPATGTWRLRIEDAEATWRLTGMWRTGETAVTLAPAS